MISIKQIPKFILLFCGLYGLWVCAPGFRPKHVRDIAVGLLNDRGVGVAIYFLAMALLIPAATRLRKSGAVATLSEAIFALISALLAVDIVFEVMLNAHGAAVWILRAVYLTVVGWGFSDRAVLPWLRSKLKAFQKSIGHKPGSRPWKIFFTLVFLFFFRQEMHLYLSRSTPFGDEVAWWYTGAKQMMDQGLRATMMGHDYGYYTPAVPWLISLPTRLVGSHHEQWLYAYPLFIMTMFLGLMLELAAGAFAFCAGFTMLFFVFLTSRDLHHLIGVTFYGEAIAALLTAVLMARLYRFWPKIMGQSRSSLAAFGLFLSFCMLTKPPISILALLFTPFLSVLIFYQKKKSQFKIQALSVFLLLSLVPYQLWKHGLSLVGRKPEYTVSVSQIWNAGINISVPLGMLKGLLSVGAPQFAYTAGLFLTLVIVAFLKKQRLLLMMLALIVVYWGFVLSLYATLWQHGDLSSAGRYLSHAALACVLLLPLAFSDKEYAL